ncbi:MAG: ABC transporter ATP-binding protein [Bacteroidales bacterium]|jgi:iron complex transport system ATP-binding protein|nr:ABC transporter ATP-binding protein [Bacteroidales bacterium]
MKKILELQQLLIGYASSKKLAKPLMPAISVSLKAGELVALTGPNGAGKTTLFRVISSNIKPLQGNVLMDGKNIADLSARHKAGLLSIVLTDRVGENFMKVYDVVASGRYPYLGLWARLTPEDKKIINRSLELSGAAVLTDRLMQSLSDGERQKVMIAKALAQDTPLILLDEPSAFLDYPSKIALIQLLKKLAADFNKTILFSSHDLDMIMRQVDKLWLMSPEKPMLNGTPDELLKSGKLQSYFGMEFIPNETVLGE